MLVLVSKCMPQQNLFCYCFVLCAFVHGLALFCFTWLLESELRFSCFTHWATIPPSRYGLARIWFTYACFVYLFTYLLLFKNCLPKYHLPHLSYFSSFILPAWLEHGFVCFLCFNEFGEMRKWNGFDSHVDIRERFMGIKTETQCVLELKSAYTICFWLQSI